MGFIEQVKTDLISNGYPYPPTYRVVLMGSSVGYFENVVGISLFSQEKIVLSLKKGSKKDSQSICCLFRRRYFYYGVSKNYI